MNQLPKWPVSKWVRGWVDVKWVNVRWVRGRSAHRLMAMDQQMLMIVLSWRIWPMAKHRQFKTTPTFSILRYNTQS